MSALSSKIAERIGSLIVLNHKGLQAVLIATIVQSFALAAATQRIEARAIALGQDPEVVTKAAYGLAQEFSQGFAPSNPDRTQRIKDLMKEIIDEEDEDLESALEEFFNLALDSEIGLGTQTEYINNLVPAEEEEA